MSQGEVCDGTPYHRSEMSKWETNSRAMTLHAVHLIVSRLVKLRAIRSYATHVAILVRLTAEFWLSNNEEAPGKTPGASETPTAE